MSKKVLIAEDDKFLANAYRVKLEKEGFEVLIVGTGKDVMDKVEEFNPGVILLDLIMPEMDGFQTLEKLKANDKTKNIPIVIASNLGQKEDLDKGKTLGATDYIIKSDSSLGSIVKKLNALAK